MASVALTPKALTLQNSVPLGFILSTGKVESGSGSEDNVGSDDKYSIQHARAVQIALEATEPCATLGAKAGSTIEDLRVHYEKQAF